MPRRITSYNVCYTKLLREQMFERYSIGGFVGYGTKNKEFKFGANFDVQPGKTDKLLLRFRYFNDYSLVSRNNFV